jgi:hypothetical protein
MRLKVFGVIASLTLFASPSAAERRVSEEALLFRQLRDGVFTVLSEEGKGSGFLVDRRGFVATNAHVIGTSRRIAVQLNDSTKVSAIVCAQDKQNDVAILRINPTLCFSLPVLPIQPDTLDLAMEGERVIAIGSPLNQERILTTGIVSKVERTAIISDVNINHGNSGGPLINLDGQTIAINTFGDFSSSGGPGVSGSISIRLIDKPLADALLASIDVPPPPATHLPVMPRAQYPIESLKRAALAADWNYKPYRVSAGNYEITVMTPPFMYHEEKRREVELASSRQAKSSTSDNTVAYDAFSDLRSWTQYLGQLAPAVTIQVVPKVGETGGSVFANLLGAAASAYSGTAYYGSHKYEFKADLNDFDLCSGDSVIGDIQRGMSWQPLDFQISGWYASASANDLARAGVFIFDPSVFLPGSTEWPQLAFDIHSEKNPDVGERFPVPQETLEAIAIDFQDYYWAQAAKSARLVVH